MWDDLEEEGKSINVGRSGGGREDGSESINVG